MLKNFFLNKVAGGIGNALNGYKTKIGGFGMILYATAGVFGHIFPDQNLPVIDWNTIITLYSGGMIALGIGHKMQTIINQGGINGTGTAGTGQGDAGSPQPVVSTKD